MRWRCVCGFGAAACKCMQPAARGLRPRALPWDKDPQWQTNNKPNDNQQADVINRGYGGYYSGYFSYMGSSLFAQVQRPKMAVLFLGVKDSKLKDWAG